MAFGNEALLRPERVQVWREFAAAVGGHYRSGDFWTPEALVVHRGAWRISVRAEVVGGLPITRAEALLAQPTGLRLDYGQGDFAAERTLDLLDVPAGEGFLRASDGRRARSLWNDPAVRSMLTLERHVALRIARHDLRLVVAGHAQERPRLRRLIVAVAALLDGLGAQAGSLPGRAEP